MFPEGKIYYRVRHLERVLFETRDVTLRGDFNLEDVLAATTAACLLGADFAAIRKAVRAFKAVEHRLEFVREIEGVDFYNNSKATSVDATLKSLEAFEQRRPPDYGRQGQRRALHAAAAAHQGARARGSADWRRRSRDCPATCGLGGTGPGGRSCRPPCTRPLARSRPGDTVLLAPACSSFDQFQDYEERGRVFKELVKQLGQRLWQREG